MLQVENLTKTFGAQALFKGAGFLVGDTDRIGIIGPNGAGKSTFFKILMGEEHADEGTVHTPKLFTKALLRQEWTPKGDDSVLTSLLKVHERWYTTKQKLETLPATSAEYIEADALFHTLGGYMVEPRAKELLSGLGFSTDQFDTPCRLFSGGWRMRVQLAGLLLAEPDLLLLDEPTNHLDVESVVWFEDFLQTYSKAFMVISHDRRLIERLSTSILEFTPPKLTLWPVKLKQFEIDKQVRVAQLESQIKNKEKKIEQLQDFANRFKAKASKARQAQSKLKSSDSIAEEVAELRSEMPLFAQRTSKFRIRTQNRMPKVVLELQHATVGYSQDKPLFTIESCVIEGGKKIGIIGVNGIGKSTFLKTCAGELPLLKGVFKKNENMNVGYFSQHRLEDLPLNQTAYDYLMDHAGGRSIGEVRATAASLGISANDLDKYIKSLSGGEKARVSLTKILMDRPDVLLLDEPTNHLDIEACDAMIDGLKEFEGTTLVVSHDRDFLDSVASLILEVRHGEAWIHQGNYTDWLARKTAAEKPKEKTESAASSKKVYKTKEQKRLEAQERQKRYDEGKKSGKSSLESSEKTIEDLQNKLKKIDHYLMQPESAKEASFYEKLKERSSLQELLSREEEKYLQLLEERESAG